MADAYNSKLISKLYTTKSENIATQIADDMVEIGAEIFVLPIFDAYLRFKKTSVSHYFVHDLGAFKGSLAIEKLLEISRQPDVHGSAIVFVLESLRTLNYYDEYSVGVAYQNLKSEFEKSYEDAEVGLEPGLGMFGEYLLTFKRLEIYKDFFKEIWLAVSASRDDRKTGLYYYLRASKTDVFVELIENFETVTTDEDSQILLAQELAGWKGANIKKLEVVILSKAVDRAREIVQQRRGELATKEAKENLKKQTEEAKSFSNMPLVIEINQLRERINLLALSSEKIKQPLFLSVESLLLQAIAVSTKAEFISRATDLRDMMEKVGDLQHGLTDQQIQANYGTEVQKDSNKPLNKLFIYLHSKGISVQSDVFGLRLFNRAVSLSFHVAQQGDLLDVLDRMKLKDAYVSQSWGVLHNRLLVYYRDALTKLESSLTLITGPASNEKK